LLLPFAGDRQTPCQIATCAQDIDGAIKTALNQARIEQRQRQELRDIALADVLRCGDLSHRSGFPADQILVPGHGSSDGFDQRFVEAGAEVGAIGRRNDEMKILPLSDVVRFNVDRNRR
jgi:hypothetical protein